MKIRPMTPGRKYRIDELKPGWIVSSSGIPEYLGIVVKVAEGYTHIFWFENNLLGYYNGGTLFLKHEGEFIIEAE